MQKTDEVVNQVAFYLDPLIDYLNNLTQEERKVVSSGLVSLLSKNSVQWLPTVAISLQSFSVMQSPYNSFSF